MVNVTAAIVTGAFTLAGVFLSTCLSEYIYERKVRLDEKQDNRARIINKHEELYRKITQWWDCSFEDIFKNPEKYIGNSSYEIPFPEEFTIQEVELIIELYLVHLSSDWKSLLKTFENFLDSLKEETDKISRFYNPNEQGAKEFYQQTVRTIAQPVIKHVEEFRAKITKSLNEYIEI